MDDAELFDEAVAQDGGRLDPSCLDPAVAQRFHSLAERSRGFLRTAAAALPKLPNIYFDFVDNWHVNAAAYKRSGRYFIGVNRGLVGTLSVFFDRMLADPEILPFIGDPAVETKGLPLIPELGTDFDRAVESVPLFPRPLDPTRLATSIKLTELALDFLTAHEFAHIANGHLDFVMPIGGLLSIREAYNLGDVPEDEESAIISQTMEMDADGTAVLISLSSEWGKIAGIYPRPGPPWTDFYNYPGMVNLQWAWAVGSIFRLFGAVRPTGEDATLENHPRPRLRSVMIQRASGRVTRPPGLATHSALIGDCPLNIPMTIKAAHTDIERIFSHITGRPVTTEELDDAWGETGRSQADRLQSFWRTKLKKELLLSAYRPLDAYGSPGSGG